MLEFEQLFIKFIVPLTKMKHQDIRKNYNGVFNKNLHDFQGKAELFSGN